MNEQSAPASLTILSRSPGETRRLGVQLGRMAQKGDIFLLIGGLVAGKTWLAQGLAQGLDVAEAAISPTFVLIREYTGRLPFYHVDLYRLETEPEVAALGLEDYLYSSGVCVVEWADRAALLMPPDNLTIRIEHLSPRRRRLRLEPHGARYERLVADLGTTGWGE